VPSSRLPERPSPPLPGPVPPPPAAGGAPPGGLLGEPLGVSRDPDFGSHVRHSTALRGRDLVTWDCLVRLSPLKVARSSQKGFTLSFQTACVMYRCSPGTRSSVKEPVSSHAGGGVEGDDGWCAGCPCLEGRPLPRVPCRQLLHVGLQLLTS